MVKNINALIFLFFLCGTGRLFAQFPYFESFKNSTAADIEYGGQPSAFLTSGNIDPVGDGFLRLTDNGFNQRGYIHNKTSFSSQYGLKISFEYYTYGGGALGRGSADGITFFLYDAAITDPNFRIGGFGGSLGYAQYKLAIDPVPVDGVTGGYLGIGLDEYGNFSNPTELREGGPGRIPSSVTLRGRGSGQGAMIPNTNIPNYRYLTHNPTTPTFGIASGSRNPNPASNDYRKAIIELEPAAAPLTGYYITVKILRGGATQTTTTIINRFYYADVAPPQVRYGLASSTGAETNFHEVRNLSINAFNPIPPVASNDLNNTTPKNTALKIPVLDNDTDLNGNATINANGITIVNQTPGAVITSDPANRGIIYTPPLGFLGTDTFFYTVKDEDGEVSNIAKVEVSVVSVKPVGANDNALTQINTPVTIIVLTNDPSKINTTVVNNTPPLGGSVIINPDGTIKYTPANGFFGNDSFTYKLKNDDGLLSDPITVTVTVMRPPLAVSDNTTTGMDVPVSIDLTANDTGGDGIVNKSSITIQTQPANGGLGLPDAQGNIIYTPKFGFTGTDNFTYTIKNDKGVESQPATVTINVMTVPKIGLAKELVSVRNSLNGTFIVRFKFTIGNYGKDLLEKISLKDDLSTALGGAQVKVIAVNPTGTLKANTNFNGIGDIELLDKSSTLPVNTVETVELILNVILLTSDGAYQNNAVAEGTSVLNGQKATDESVAGEKPDPFVPGDISPKGPTFFQLKKGPLYIPQGFSPNGDGINDVFIVSNSQGKVISLDVYNRWGNRVYKSDSYGNDWGGRCTEGVTIGQDLPVGTYYYIIVIDNKDKYVGYITINR